GVERGPAIRRAGVGGSHREGPRPPRPPGPWPPPRIRAVREAAGRRALGHDGGGVRPGHRTQAEHTEVMEDAMFALTLLLLAPPPEAPARPPGLAPDLAPPVPVLANGHPPHV